MEAFEAVIATLLRTEGYWVWPSFKVDLTKEEKREIGRHSSPRWELDLLGYKGSTNELLVVECKSFLNSPGVSSTFLLPGSTDARRYKLFTEPTTREVVFRRLIRQLREMGACAPEPKLQLALAAGHIRNDAERAALHREFREREWLLIDEPAIADGLRKLSSTSYENDIAAVVTKLVDVNW